MRTVQRIVKEAPHKLPPFVEFNGRKFWEERLLEEQEQAALVTRDNKEPTPGQASANDFKLADLKRDLPTLKAIRTQDQEAK